MPDTLSFCDGWAGNDPADSPAKLLGAPISFYFTIYSLVEIWLCITGYFPVQWCLFSIWTEAHWFSGNLSEHVYNQKIIRRSGDDFYGPIISVITESQMESRNWPIKTETTVKYHRTEMLSSGERGTLIRGEHFRTFLRCSTTSGCVKLGQGNMDQ